MNIVLGVNTIKLSKALKEADAALCYSMQVVLDVNLKQHEVTCMSICPLKIMIKRTTSAMKGLIYKTLTQYNQIKLRSFSKAFKQLILRPVQM